MQAMDKKRIQSLRSRINRAMGSLSCMGDMLLTFEVDAMTQEERIQLREALLNSRKPLAYPYLDAKIAKGA